MIGTIVQRNEQIKSIDINFADFTNKKKITFFNTHNFNMAVLNNCGAFFANKLDETELDEYENDDKKDNAVIEFRAINNYSLLKNWTYSLPNEENPISLAIGVNYCACYTDNNNIRVFSLSGVQKMIISMTQVISMSGHENHLAIVYHSATPLFGNQSLRVKILNMNDYKEVYDGVLPLSNFATLAWFGYSEDGVLFTYDSDKILRGFSIGVFNSWVVLFDAKEVYPNTYYWIIGIQDEEVYGLELKGAQTEPTLGIKLVTKVHKLKMPFIKTSTSDNEEKVANNNFFIKHETWRLNTYKTLKDFRSARMPEYYYTDSLKDDNEINTRKKEHDKEVLNSMKDFIVAGNPEKAMDLYEILLVPKSRELAISLATTLEENELAIYFKSRMNYLKIIESKEEPIPVRSSYSHSYLKMNNKPEEDSNTNILSSIAINVDTYKDIEDEVKNDLVGYADEDRRDDFNSINLKYQASLEKKNVNFFNFRVVPIL
jgi:hypothetical protein